MNTLTHLLKSKNHEAFEEVSGVFDSKAPYYISLGQTGSIPRDIFICDYHKTAEGRKDEYNICFYGDSNYHQGIFILKIFATGEKDALKRALKIRGAVIRNGEWDLAWERHKLQQSKLLFSRNKC